jgi:hypothetical protein
MDLTTSYPASVRETLLGIVQLKRTIDKGKAFAQGTNGEYDYNCPMDKHLFAFLGIDGEDLLDVIKSAESDDEIVEYVAPYVHAKTDEELAAFNRDWLTHAPAPGSGAETYFFKLRGEIAPDRTDVTTWPDLLDLDEKRPVPRRTALV